MGMLRVLQSNQHSKDVVKSKNDKLLAEAE